MITTRFRLSPLALLADRAEMFVDAEDDQHELGSDAGEDDADQDTHETGEHDEKACERIGPHRHQPGKDARQAVQHGEYDREPVEDLDDRGRNETVPLKE